MADIGILENVPLAGYSTFRCGGPARYFAEPATGDEVARLFRLAGEQNWDVWAGYREVYVSSVCRPRLREQI